MYTHHGKSFEGGSNNSIEVVEAGEGGGGTAQPIAGRYLNESKSAY